MSSPAAQFLNTFATTQISTTTVAGYSLGPIIGYGSTSVIRKAYSAAGSTVAVKVVSLSTKSSLKQHLREAATWSVLSHEHILPLFAFHHSPSHFYFFTLYCPAGTLLDVLKSLGTPALLQDDAGMIFRQVVRGLRYLHEVAGFVHRDIKLENVLIDEMGFCRIADFGMAVRFLPSPSTSSDDEDEDDLLQSHPSPRYHRNSTSTHSLLSIHHHNKHNHFQPGSLPYVAPELLLPRPIHLNPHHPISRSRPHPSQDIWALGVLLYALLAGTLPFFDTFDPRLQLKILNASYTPPQDIGLGAERILKGCLDKNIHTRWSIAMVDDVAWGVGWGREGDGAGVADIDHQVERPQINSAAFVHRDYPPFHTDFSPTRPTRALRTCSPEIKNKRARSKSLGAPISRSLSPSSLSPSPTYRFPPSLPSRSPSTSPSRSPLSPIHSEEPDVISLVSDFNDREQEHDRTLAVAAEINRGRKMRSLAIPKDGPSSRHYRSAHHHHIEEEDELDLSLEFETSARLT